MKQVQLLDDRLIKIYASVFQRVILRFFMFWCKWVEFVAAALAEKNKLEAQCPHTFCLGGVALGRSFS